MVHEPCPTRHNTFTAVVGKIANPLLGPVDSRKAIMIMPIAGGLNAVTPVVAVQFAGGSGQPWVVPTGVTALLDAYVWGPGGAPGAPGDTLGGGGGGGGGFAAAGPKVLTPGSVWTVDVAFGGTVAATKITDPTATVVASAFGGNNGLNDAHGTGGAATVGVRQETGGNGDDATALVGNGAGGGGAAGSFAAGGNAAASVGGAGGGVATIKGFGVGGVGGNGASSGQVGVTGAIPGGGGGGGGAGALPASEGADGLAIIFYEPSSAQQALSMSFRADVQPGLGIFNWLPDNAFPLVLTDEEIGDIINQPWYFISAQDGVTICVSEVLYGY